jgi:hypothetical protein
MSDITQITLAKPGTDKLCVAGLVLLVNGQTAITRSYGNDAATCVQVGGNAVLNVPFEGLRSAPSWNLVGNIIPTSYSAADLRSMIMARFGHHLHGIGELRNGNAITTSFTNELRIRVKVPIKVYDVAEIAGVAVLGDVDSDVSFDLVLTGSHLSVENVDASSSDFLGYFLPIIGWKILWETSQGIEAAVKNMGSTSVGSSAPVGLHVCFKPDASIGVCFDQ